MNKKILIISLFATLMLLVPINSVVGVSDVEEDCSCQVVNRYDLFRVKLLMFKLKVITNTILLRFGHIPQVTEKCQEILDIINSGGLLENFCNAIWDIADYLNQHAHKFPDKGFLYFMFLGIAEYFATLYAIFCD
jgi:hypothetical protein